MNNMNREMELLIAGLENARAAINLALTTIESFYASIEEKKAREKAYEGCKHPEDKLENIAGMGERPTYLCTVCKEIVAPRDPNGEETEVEGSGKDTS